MNADDILRKKLLALAIPEPDPAARDRALDDAIRELRVAPRASPAPRQPRHSFLTMPRWVLVTEAGAVALLVVLAVTIIVHRITDERSSTLTAEHTLLSEMEVLFGSQLDAVIERPDGPPDIRLSTNSADTAQPSLAQPVFIEFHRDGRETTRVLSYSGRDVCVMLAGRRTCFEPLVTGGGEVILSGERCYWNSRQPASELDGYRVVARLLPRS